MGGVGDLEIDVSAESQLTASPLPPPQVTQMPVRTRQEGLGEGPGRKNDPPGPPGYGLSGMISNLGLGAVVDMPRNVNARSFLLPECSRVVAGLLLLVVFLSVHI